MTQGHLLHHFVAFVVATFLVKDKEGHEEKLHDEELNNAVHDEVDSAHFSLMDGF